MFYRQRQHTQLVPVKTLAFSNVRIVALATPIVTIRIAAEFLLPYCLNAKHLMGRPKRDGMNRSRAYWMRWSKRQLQPGVDIGAEAEPVVKRGSEVT